MRMQRHQGRLRRLVLPITGIVGATFGLAVALPTAASASQVSNVSVSVNSNLAGNTGAQWKITFTPATSLGYGDDIIINFPSGITIGVASGSIYEFGCFGSSFGASASTVEVSLGTTCSASAGTPSTVLLYGISPVAGTYAQSGFSVSTTRDIVATAGSGTDIVIKAPVTYNALASDGTTVPTGSAPTDASSPYSANSTVTVLGNTGGLALSGYAFAGWCTTDVGYDPRTCIGTSYAPNATFPATTDVNLYSLWVGSLTAADGSGTATVSPTSVAASSTGKTLTFTYTAATDGMNNGEVDITVPTGWSFPSTSNVPGCTTASTGTVAVSSQTIQVTGVTLAGGTSLMVTYGATSGGVCQIGDGVTAPATTGAATFTTKEMSTSSGTLTALASSPTVTVNAATALDGSGTATVSPTSVVASSTGKTLTFTYTAATGGLNNGEVDITVPSGWTAPTTANAAGCTTASAGAVSIGVGQVIQVSALTLAGNNPVTVTYGATSNGNCAPGDGVAAPATSGSSRFSTEEKSTSSGTLTAISSSPSVSVTSSSPGSGSVSTATSPPVISLSLPTSVSASTQPTNTVSICVVQSGSPVVEPVQLTADPSAGASFADYTGDTPGNPYALSFPAQSSHCSTAVFGDSQPGSVTITASIPGASASEVVQITAATPPASLILSSSAATASVSGSIALTAAVTPAAASAPVTFSVKSGPDAGTVLHATTDSAGTATVTLVNDGTAGSDTVTASMTDPVSRNALSASRTVTFAATVPGNTVPGKPTIISATPGDGSATIKFSPPTSDGGAKITSYLVTATDETNPSGSTTATAGQSPITVSGLVNGDHYSFTVRASNSVGEGPKSAPASAVPVGCSNYSGNGAFVCALYKDFLGRPAGRSGVQKWTKLIANGTSRAAVASMILDSTEYRQDFVDSVYVQFLHRHVGSKGLSTWVGKLKAGMTGLQLKEEIALTPEFFDKASTAAPACSSLTGNQALVCAVAVDFQAGALSLDPRIDQG